jgi:hypothetical protein
VINLIAKIILNLMPSKAAVKLELMFNKPVSDDIMRKLNCKPIKKIFFISRLKAQEQLGRRSKVSIFLEKHVDHGLVVAVVVAQSLAQAGTPLDKSGDAADARVLGSMLFNFFLRH